MRNLIIIQLYSDFFNRPYKVNTNGNLSFIEYYLNENQIIGISYRSYPNVLFEEGADFFNDFVSSVKSLMHEPVWTFQDSAVSKPEWSNLRTFSYDVMDEKHFGSMWADFRRENEPSSLGALLNKENKSGHTVHVNLWRYKAVENITSTQIFHMMTPMMMDQWGNNRFTSGGDYEKLAAMNQKLEEKMEEIEAILPTEDDYDYEDDDDY